MEKVQSETWVGAMTPEQILELAHEAGFPRDTIFYRSDQFITFAIAIVQRTRDECAVVCDKWVDVNHVYTNGAIRCAESIRGMK